MNPHEPTGPDADSDVPAGPEADPVSAPFGTWDSPISAAAASAAGAKRTDLLVHDGEVYWSERRPEEGGRTVLVKATSTGPVDVIGPERNARSRAHEYGGGCTLACERGLFFVDDATRSLIWNTTPPRDLGPETHVAETVLLTDQDSALADLCWDPPHHRLLAIREVHVDDGHPLAELVSLSLPGGDEDENPTSTDVDGDGPAPESGGLQVLFSAQELGCDFLSNPEPSPDGRQLAFLGWSHPHMPWDETTLWLAELDASGNPQTPRRIAGGQGVSVFQPRWSEDGVLHYVDDSTGWWNIWRRDKGGPRNLTPIAAEFGLPQWVFGMSTYAIPRNDRIVAICSQGGLWRMVWLDPSADGDLHPLLGGDDEPSWSWCDSVAADAETVAVLAAGPRTAPTVLSWATSGLSAEARPSPQQRTSPPELDLPDDLISAGVPISFESPLTVVATAGDRGARRTSHAFYYPPRNPDFSDAEGRPPLLVKSHGGPTAATSNALDLQIQYWTSRGFAVVDVNYAGSTGYGREYRDALRGAWGVRDVEDCTSAALALAERGEADRSHLLIRGGSAGGYTTLAALAFTDVFCAGASLYGIGDLEALARDTHKFEAHYLDSMVGPYPEARPLYVERSPLHHAQALSCPVIFFQGSEDKVVPPNQSEAMVEALRAKGVRTEYVLYEGEGHGFRRAENIIDVLERELAFYLAVLGLAEHAPC